MQTASCSQMQITRVPWGMTPSYRRVTQEVSQGLNLSKGAGGVELIIRSPGGGVNTIQGFRDARSLKCTQGQDNITAPPACRPIPVHRPAMPPCTQNNSILERNGSEERWVFQKANEFFCTMALRRCWCPLVLPPFALPLQGWGCCPFVLTVACCNKYSSSTCLA